MVDANQKFLFPEALLRGRVYQEMGCFWYEEPMMPHEMREFGRAGAGFGYADRYGRESLREV